SVPMGARQLKLLRREGVPFRGDRVDLGKGRLPTDGRAERVRARKTAAVVTLEDVRAAAMRLPRTTEALVRGRVKFRIGSLVYLAFSRDETVMGFAFPKEERDAIVVSEPDKF